MRRPVTELARAARHTRSGARSATAAAILRQAGFGQVRNLAGGMLEWNARHLPAEH